MVVGLFLLVYLVRELARDDSARRRVLLIWTLVAFLVHIVLGIAIWVFLQFALDDAYFHHETAKALVRHWAHGTPLPEILPGKGIFLYTMAAVYYGLGVHPEAMLVVNAILAAALIPIMADTTRRLFGTSAERFGLPLFLLLPGLLIWTAVLLREAMVLFVLSVTINVAVRLSQRVTFRRFAALILSVVTLAGFRISVALAVGLGILAAFAASAPNGSTRVRWLAALGVASVLGILFGQQVYDRVIGVDLEKVHAIRSVHSAGATSGVDPTGDVSTPGNAALFVAAHLLESFAGPFPWQIGTLRHTLALPDVIVWWCLLPVLFAGIRWGMRRLGPRVLILLLPAAATQVMLTVSFGEFGTLIRQRPQAFLPLLPFIAFGLSERLAGWRGQPTIPSDRG
jgi:hypothetical protein